MGQPNLKLKGWGSHRTCSATLSILYLSHLTNRQGEDRSANITFPFWSTPFSKAMPMFDPRGSVEKERESRAGALLNPGGGSLFFYPNLDPLPTMTPVRDDMSDEHSANSHPPNLRGSHKISHPLVSHHISTPTLSDSQKQGCYLRVFI
jgi:hypothetical protein